MRTDQKQSNTKANKENKKTKEEKQK